MRKLLIQQLYFTLLYSLFLSMLHPERGRFWFKDITNYNKTASLNDCQRWIQENATNSFDYDACEVNRCPPSEVFVIASGLQCIREDPKFKVRTCYRLWNWVSPRDLSLNGDLVLGRTVSVTIQTISKKCNHERFF